MKRAFLTIILSGNLLHSNAQSAKLSLGGEVHAGFAVSAGGLGGNAGIWGIMTYQPLKQIGLSAGMGGYFITHPQSDKHYGWTQKIDYLAPQLNVIATPFAGLKESSAFREIHGLYLEAGVSSLFLCKRATMSGANRELLRHPDILGPTNRYLKKVSRSFSLAWVE